MRLFLGNILLTFVWVFLTGELSIVNFLMGYFICYFVLWIIFRKFEHNAYFRKGPAILSLLGYFIKQVIFSNFKIAYDLLTPGNYMEPGIIKIKNNSESQLQFILFSNLITLTPGSMVLDYDEEDNALYVHLLYAKNEEVAVQELKILEGKIKKAIK